MVLWLSVLGSGLMRACGTWSGYTGGCRCDDCRTAARLYIASTRARGFKHRSRDAAASLPPLATSVTADRELRTVLATYMLVDGVMRRYVRIDGRWLRDDRLVT